MKFLKKNLFQIVFSVLALLVICLFATKFVQVNDKGCNGFQAVFGWRSGDTIVTNFNFGGFLALLLVCGAVACAWLKFPCNVYTAGLLMVVAGVIMFFIPAMAPLTETGKNYLGWSSLLGGSASLSLAPGAIVDAILAIVFGALYGCKDLILGLIKK